MLHHRICLLPSSNSFILIRFVDRDMFMRFRGGGVGHKSTRKETNRFLSDRHVLDLTEEASCDDEVEEECFEDSEEESATDDETEAEDDKDLDDDDADEDRDVELDQDAGY